MKLIQTILILGFLASLMLYLTHFRSSLLDRLLALGLFCGALAVVIFPDLSSLIAQAVGVGRGVDLFLYLFALATIFCLILLYSKARRTERTIAELARQIALRDARTIE